MGHMQDIWQKSELLYTFPFITSSLQPTHCSQEQGKPESPVGRPQARTGGHVLPQYLVKASPGQGRFGPGSARPLSSGWRDSLVPAGLLVVGQPSAHASCLSLPCSCVIHIPEAPSSCTIIGGGGGGVTVCLLLSRSALLYPFFSPQRTLSFGAHDPVVSRKILPRRDCDITHLELSLFSCIIGHSS